MLTLNFRDALEDSMYVRNNKYLSHDYKFLTAKFSNSTKERPYIMIAKPLLHKRGRLAESLSHAFSNRSIDTKKLGEALSYSPILMRVTMMGKYYLIAKGFVAEVLTNYFDPTGDKFNILFCITGHYDRYYSSPHDLKIYLNRELYDDKYKRLMSVLKPFMSSHQGDIIVTKSINDYLLYQFELPNISTYRDRMKFDGSFKEFFFRSIKYSKWRKEEDVRIEVEEARREQLEKETKRLKTLQARILAIVDAEQARLIEPEVSIQPETQGQVEAFLEGESQPTQAVQSVPVLEISEGGLRTMELRQEQIAERRRLAEIMQERVREMQREEWQQQREATENQQAENIQGRFTEATVELTVDLSELGTLDPQTMEVLSASIRLQQPQQPISQSLQDGSQQEQQQSLSQPTQPLGEPLSSQEPISLTLDSSIVNPNVEHISDEEMQRILSQFAIVTEPVEASSISVNYDGVSGAPVDRARSYNTEEVSGEMNNLLFEVSSGGVPEMNEVFDEDTDLVIIDDTDDDNVEDGLEYEEGDNEESLLDDDPNAYSEAEVVEEPDEEDNDETPEEAQRFAQVANRLRTSRDL